MLVEKIEDVDIENGSILLIDKPLRWTSFDIVNKLKKYIRTLTDYKKFKIGHAGTLDPLASGLLIICVGKATKRIEELQLQEKQYLTTFTLGAVTASHDLEKDPTDFKPYHSVNEQDIKNATTKFIGNIEQIPPQYSAIKVDGKRAFDYMRDNQDITLKSRKIQIKRFELIKYCPPHADFVIDCSKGTYIRSLARDMGDILGCGAYISALRRTAIGNFKVENALQTNLFENSEKNIEKKHKLRDFERII
ncbi:MAG: tRNA pseudouridine(55) synthase TruB [Bacteroidales bacterium]|jgi:tRNA pseudouridine55 synthase|nr:tRNA pseudouridine(55) synthase TruB [Bacteroidales bacterium]